MDELDYRFGMDPIIDLHKSEISYLFKSKQDVDVVIDRLLSLG